MYLHKIATLLARFRAYIKYLYIASYRPNQQPVTTVKNVGDAV